MTANILSGRDVEFLFEEDETWRTSIDEISYVVNEVDYGNRIQYFTINEAGRIATQGVGFTNSEFIFTIKAPGYEDVVLTVDFSDI